MASIEHLDLLACGVPCANCPVGQLALDKRVVVDRVLSAHGPEIDYDLEIYPWDDAKSGDYQIPGTANEELQLPEIIRDMMPEAPDEEANAVLRAVIKIVNEGCPTYSEGEI